MFWHKTLSNILAYNFTQYICTQQYTIYWHITLQTVYQYNYTQYIGTHFLEYIGTQLHMKYWNTDYWRKNLHNILAFNFSLYIGTQLNEIYWHKWGLDIRVCEAFCVAIFSIIAQTFWFFWYFGRNVCFKIPKFQDPTQCLSCQTPYSWFPFKMT